MPGKRNIEIRKGDDYSHVVTMRNSTGAINISGRTYTAQLRKIATQTNPDATLTCTVTNGAGGEITISLSHTVTSTLDTGCYKWDLQENSGGTITTILAGEARVVTDVTR